MSVENMKLRKCNKLLSWNLASGMLMEKKFSKMIGSFVLEALKIKHFLHQSTDWSLFWKSAANLISSNRLTVKARENSCVINIVFGTDDTRNFADENKEQSRFKEAWRTPTLIQTLRSCHSRKQFNSKNTWRIIVKAILKQVESTNLPIFP